MKRLIHAAMIPLLVVAAHSQEATPEIDAMEYAKGAARWILSLSRTDGDRLTWSVNDTDKDAPSFTLYSGMPGGILLLAELAGQDPSSPFAEALGPSIKGLESLRITTDRMTAWGHQRDDSSDIPAGLYTGNAGIGWLFLELHRITGDREHLERARLITHTLLYRPQFLEGRAIWDDSTDIVSGAAGTGLFLLRAAVELKDPRCLDMATAAGRFLLSEAIQTPTGLKWKIDPRTPRLYPNFSHGTAGVAFFLARLAEATRDRRFFDAARRGAQEMEAIATVEGDRCTWYHHEDAGENLWYVSWCHGPAGTARLFHQLARTTSDKRWSAWVDRSASWILQSGIPEPVTPINGYWNESLCCGTAGVGEFLIDLYLATRRKVYLDAAEKMALHLVDRADRASGGYRWIQAEHRVSPDHKDAQTGYAQGAAGFGLFFLKLARARRGMPSGWKMPDNPF